MSAEKCYGCVHRQNVPGGAHSACNNSEAEVRADFHGVKNGWFLWPYNFDPVWLIECSGFKEKNNGEGMKNND